MSALFNILPLVTGKWSVYVSNGKCTIKVRAAMSSPAATQLAKDLQALADGSTDGNVIAGGVVFMCMKDEQS